MNYTRLAIAAVVATTVDMIYGYVVYGIVLSGEFSRYPGVFRPMEAVNPNIPLMAAGVLVAMFALAYIYGKGYEGGSGFQEGMRFGGLVGIFGAGYVAVGNYVVMNIGRRMAVAMAVAGLLEFAIVGITIGLVYKPAAKA
jgi:hypothetical protein